jgi:ribosomal protein S18 acetylase RimI-like enzyme
MRQRESGALIAFLETGEPRTSHALSDVVAYGLGPLRSRAWLVADPHGAPAAAVVITRSCLDRWYAHTYFVDGGAAPAAASILDASPAWTVTGAARDIRPLLPHLRRLRWTSAFPWLVDEYPVSVTRKADRYSRVATLADFEQLVELYRGYELGANCTMWQLRSIVRDWLRHQIVVVSERKGRVVGAILVIGRTRRYAVVDGLTVLPEYRNRGVAWSLAARAQAVINGMGLSVTACIAASNPMKFDAETIEDERWVVAALGEPYRFRGEGRLRAMSVAIAGRDPREIVYFRDPRDPDAPPPRRHAPTSRQNAKEEGV